MKSNYIKYLCQDYFENVTVSSQTSSVIVEKHVHWFLLKHE